MDKPEWCSADIWSDALQVASPLPIGDLGQKTLAREVAKAILSAQSQAYIDAARIAIEGYKCRTCGHVGPIEHSSCESWDIDVATNSEISAAILQRKEEIGRN